MDYAIKNNGNVYIKLDSNGRPVTCSESVKGIFEYSKARNILDHLPKTMKKFHFKLEAIPEIKPKETKKISKKIEKKDEYIPSEDIIRWIEKFGTCADILDEARERQGELIEELHKTDKELLDILHIIEIERPKDLYHGWLLYRKIRDNRKKRRSIKDEILIIKNVLRKINHTFLQRESIQKAINGLLNREYTFRIAEEDDIEDADL